MQELHFNKLHKNFGHKCTPISTVRREKFDLSRILVPYYDERYSSSEDEPSRTPNANGTPRSRRKYVSPQKLFDRIDPIPSQRIQDKLKVLLYPYNGE